MKTISGNIFRWDLGDCTGNGVSAKAKSLNLIWNNDDLDLEKLNDNDLVLTEFEYAGEITLRAVPVSLIKGDKWYMFGGNFIYSSDSRFPSKSPIKIFDRVES